MITTIAGSGTAGFQGDGGQATAAELNRPAAIIVDQAETLLSPIVQTGCAAWMLGQASLRFYAGTGSTTYNGDGVRLRWHRLTIRRVSSSMRQAICT